METYLLVARSWRTQCWTRRKLNRMVNLMIGSARIASSTPQAGFYRNNGISRVSFKWRDHWSKVVMPDVSGFLEAINNAHNSIRNGLFSIPLLEIDTNFMEVSLKNGKTIIFERLEQEWDDEGRLIQVESDRLVYDDKIIISGKFYSKRFINNKVWIMKEINQDLGKTDEYAYLVVNFAPVLSNSGEPVIRELVRVEGHAKLNNSTFHVEQKSGKLWWNTPEAIVREGRHIIMIPPRSWLSHFEVSKDHLAMAYYPDEVGILNN